MDRTMRRFFFTVRAFLQERLFAEDVSSSGIRKTIRSATPDGRDLRVPKEANGR
ncbi:hypothetical protein LFML04_0048 [Leptospirillum ferriphilum ML-04]|uniref:Uncharacterized protein n=1 Tax=Leptospirillum ferriphilum (strain ML-04) TaxID=1048260 RepID=J9Z9I6_LEPFM|nr:hypothetical protein LFML04_0048 [Leptospirillum ferriphilum ML-04]